MKGIKWRIWQANLLLFTRIKSNNTGSLCRQVYEEGRAKGWPGLGMEVKQICEELEIPDINNVCLTKAEIKRAISENHYKDVKKELDKSTKMEHVKGEDFYKVQEYFNDKSVENCRMSSE